MLIRHSAIKKYTKTKQNKFEMFSKMVALATSVKRGADGRDLCPIPNSSVALVPGGSGLLLKQ